MHSWFWPCVLAWVASMALGGWLASRKGRSPEEGLMVGVLLGPIGPLVAALLPAQAPRSPEHL
jgi:hypothetical protein